MFTDKFILISAVECATSMGWRAEGMVIQSPAYLAVIFKDMVFNCPGLVTSWSFYRTSEEGSVYAAVFRENDNGLFSMIGSTLLPPASEGQQDVYIDSGASIGVLPGDVLGIYYPAGEIANPVSYATSTDKSTYCSTTGGYHCLNHGDLSSILTADVTNLVDNVEYSFTHTTIRAAVPLQATIVPEQDSPYSGK